MMVMMVAVFRFNVRMMHLNYIIIIIIVHCTSMSGCHSVHFSFVNLFSPPFRLDFFGREFSGTLSFSLNTVNKAKN